jgi:glycine betaine/proline transport system substrate-binding protein
VVAGARRAAARDGSGRMAGDPSSCTIHPAAGRFQEEENGLSLQSSAIRRLAVGVAAIAIIVSACSGSAASTAPSSAPAAAATTAPSTGASAAASTAPSTAASLAACGTVNIADNAWIGYEADVAVVAYLLKNQLGCKVNIKSISEQVSWQGFPTGDVDVILENWGHEDLAKTYITDQKVAVDLGSQGNQGIIGWYIPKTYADAHPNLLTANSDPKAFAAALNAVSADFVTSESGGKGQILDGDPSYVTNDEALVTGLGLNYKVVYSGSEAASDKAIKAAVDAGKPILAYYWEPNWFSTQVSLVHLQLPAYTAGCDSNAKSMTCDYPPYPLNKVASVAFMNSGSPAATLIKNFKWTNDAQNQVATDIALNKLSDDAAAKKWLDANPTVWQAWMP